MLGMGYVILLWHSLSLYNYFEAFLCFAMRGLVHDVETIFQLL